SCTGSAGNLLTLPRVSAGLLTLHLLLVGAPAHAGRGDAGGSVGCYVLLHKDRLRGLLMLIGTNRLAIREIGGCIRKFCGRSHIGNDTPPAFVAARITCRRGRGAWQQRTQRLSEGRIGLAIFPHPLLNRARLYQY